MGAGLRVAPPDQVTTHLGHMVLGALNHFQSQVKRAWPFVNWKSGVIILVSLFLFLCVTFSIKNEGENISNLRP